MLAIYTLITKTGDGESHCWSYDSELLLGFVVYLNLLHTPQHIRVHN